MDMHMGKNYHTDEGDRLVIGGTLEFGNGAKVENFPGAANQAASTASDVSGIKDDFNALLLKLKTAGIVRPDAWNLSVLACPTPASMPPAETAANSGHATVAVDGSDITITLDCEVSDLADADHGSTWSTHKWLGFGVRTGLSAVAGIKFTDDTGVSVTLGDADAAEATTLGLSAGDFVLYVKAEDAAYLSRDKSFTLELDGMAKTTYTMKIVETKS